MAESDPDNQPGPSPRARAALPMAAAIRHSCNGFIPTRDRSLTGAWIALDDATVENGCLWVLPGSHREGVLWPQREHRDERFDCTHESWNFPWCDADSIPVEMKAGSIVFFNGYLLHWSLPNRSLNSFRRTLVNPRPGAMPADH
jgi:phytanoyl-CoA hydroxylase